MYKLVHAQPIVIPASQFPQVSAPSNSMRFLMVYPPGGLSANPLLASNATISYANLVRVLELALTNTSGGGGGGKVSVYSNGVPLVGVASNLNFADFYTNPSSNGGTATIDLGASATTFNINTASNQIYNNVISDSSGFITLILTNMTTAQIQGVLNGVTNGGVVSIQPGNYTITSTLSLTNPMIIEGNQAVFTFTAGKTNFLFNNGTNSGKPLIIKDFVFDGGVNQIYNSSNFFTLIHRSTLLDNADPAYSSFWTNRGALKLEVSGGVLIDNCTFFDWPGTGCMFTDVASFAGFNSPKFIFSRNRCYSNYLAVLVVANTGQQGGYGNNNISFPVDTFAEYGLIQGNDIFANYMGVCEGAGNGKVDANTINYNWIGLFISQSGFNGSHGAYQDNTLNHNNYAIYSEYNPGGIYSGNNILRNDLDSTVNARPASGTGVHFNNVTSFMFVNNRMGLESLVFTNSPQGIIAHNTFESNSVWGGIINTNPLLVGYVFTNIDPAVLVYDNWDNNGSNNDGTMGSILMHATNSPFSGAIVSTPDGKVASWITPPSGSGSLFPPNAAGVLVNNGSGTTNWLSTNSIINAASNNAVSALPSQTNFIAFDWSGNPTLTNAGLIPVFVGFNPAGDLLVKGTNYPTGGGSTPNGLVTNNGTVTVLVPGLNITNTSPAQSENLFGAIGAVTVPPSVINTGVLFLQSKTNGITAASSAFAVGSVLVQGPRGVLSLGTDVQLLSTNSSTLTYQWWDTNNVVHIGSNSLDTITLTPNTGSVVATNLQVVSIVTPTNNLGGTVIDFSSDEVTTNLAGNLTLSTLANIKLGMYNFKLIHVLNSSGSDRTVTLTTGWGVGLGDTFVCTNNTRMNLWAECQPGVYTNVFQKQIITH